MKAAARLLLLAMTFAAGAALAGAAPDDAVAPSFKRPAKDALVLLLLERSGEPRFARGDDMILAQLGKQLAQAGYRTAVLDHADYEALEADELATRGGRAPASEADRRRTLARLAHIAADSSHCALLVRARLVARKAKFDALSAEWDGQRRGLDIEGAGDIKVRPNYHLAGMRYSGEVGAISVELVAFDADGAFAFLTHGGVQVPYRFNVAERTHILRDDMFQTDDEIADGLKIALEPLRP